jgi:type IV secretion system protein VirB8
MIYGDKELKQYFNEARRFDQDRLVSLGRSQRIAWIIAGIQTLVAIAAVMAVIMLTPLKTVIPYVIRVDNATGIPEVMTSLTDGQTSYNEELEKYFLATYVRAREGYNFAARAYRFKQVQLLSSPEEQEQFATYYNASNPKSPQYIYGKKAKAEIDVRSVSFLGKNVAQVVFTRTIKREDSKASISKWRSTINYKFDPKAEISFQDRTINPLGFIVTDYRVDNEVVK